MQRVRQQQERAERLREKFIEACENLNARILAHHLQESDVICGMGKWEFLAYLRDLFQELENKEILKLVMVKKCCLKCHLRKTTMEFYAIDTAPEYWRYQRRSKTINELKPEFAFVPIEGDPTRFDVERCEHSWGFYPGGRWKEWDEISRKVHGYFG
jgi:hypothetical protein